MRWARWLFLAVLVGIFSGMLWAGYQVANAPPATAPLEPPPVVEAPAEPALPRRPEALEPYLTLIRHTADRPVLESLLTLEGGIVYHAHLALARLHGENEDPTLAGEHYAQALALYSSPTVEAEYAGILEELGDEAAAAALWERLLPRDAAVQGLLRLLEPVQAAVRLNRTTLHALALEVLAGNPCSLAQLERARAHSGLGEHPRALSYFRDYLQQHPDDQQARVQYALARDRSGDALGALAEYARAGPAGRRARGRLLERLGRRPEAIEDYLRSPDAEAQWRAGQLLELEGHHARAMSVYRELALGTSRLADDAALRLYLHHLRGQDRERAETYQHKLSLALSYLAGVFDGSWRVVDEPEPQERPVALHLADVLLEHFTVEWSLVELGVLLKTASPAERVAVGTWYMDHGFYRSAARLGMGMLTHTPAPSVYRLAYPRAYPDLVGAAANEFGVDPYLIWAVMREESHFQPDALSWADARGLMQVIPSTGEWIAQRLGEPYRLADLYKPEVSIRFGAWYLAHLLEQFDGQLAKAVAAYNGGPGSVTRWMGSPVYQEPVDLPGVAAFPETREYIDKVISSWLVYHWLYGQE